MRSNAMLLITLMVGSSLLGQPLPASRPVQGAGTLDLAHSVVTADEPAVADLPVLLRVSVPNSSGSDLRLMLTGPGEYLQAGQFGIHLMIPGQPPRTLRPFNGQFSQGLLSDVTVNAGQSLVVPLAIDPQEVGTYQGELLSVDRFENRPEVVISTFRIEVRAGADLRRTWIDQRIAEIRRGDPFAASVCLHYKIEPVIDALLNDLEGPETNRARSAARFLQMYYQYSYKAAPESWVAAITKALQRHVDDPVEPYPRTGPPGVAGPIVRLATTVRDDRFLPFFISYSHSADVGIREEAMRGLSGIGNSASIDRLAEMLASSEKQLRWSVAWSLVNRGDKRGLPELARSAVEQTENRSGGRPEFDLLVMFPDEPVARDAVAAGLRSADPEIRASVQRSMQSSSPFVDPVLSDATSRPVAGISMQDAARMLLEARDFIVIDASTAAAAPQPLIAFRMLHGSRASYAAMNHLYLDGTTAAKLYALCGFYMQSDRNLANKADAIAAAGGQITVIDGSRQTSMPLKQVVEKIVSGEYPQRLLRLYPTTTPAPP